MVSQFPDLVALNKKLRQLYLSYYIDIDHDHELSIVDRSIIQEYWVDIDDPVHPAAYIMAGKSVLPYVERMTYIYPVPTKKCLKYDLSAYHKALISAQEFFDDTKDMKKTRIVPSISAMEFDEGLKVNSLILRQDEMEVVIPILELPKRINHRDEYFKVLNSLVYQKFYRYLPGYLKQDLKWNEIPSDDLVVLKEGGLVRAVTPEGEVVNLNKEIFPNINTDQRMFIASVPEPNITEDQINVRGHYIIQDSFYLDDDADATPYMSTFTLVSALRMKARE